jgi:hypothetical protein
MNHFPAVHPLAELQQWRSEAMRSVASVNTGERIGGAESFK